MEMKWNGGGGERDQSQLKWEINHKVNNNNNGTYIVNKTTNNVIIITIHPFKNTHTYRQNQSIVLQSTPTTTITKTSVKKKVNPSHVCMQFKGTYCTHYTNSNGDSKQTHEHKQTPIQINQLMTYMYVMVYVVVAIILCGMSQ